MSPPATVAFAASAMPAAGTPAPDVRNSHTNPPPGLYGQADFREGFAELARTRPLLRGLAVPSAAAGSDGAGPRRAADHDRAQPRRRPARHRALCRQARRQVFATWKADMRRAGALPQRRGEAGRPRHGYRPLRPFQRPVPPTSRELAQAWRPYIETCIDAFGAERGMFESNFPVDKRSTCATPRCGTPSSGSRRARRGLRRPRCSAARRGGSIGCRDLPDRGGYSARLAHERTGIIQPLGAAMTLLPDGREIKREADMARQ